MSFLQLASLMETTGKGKTTASKWHWEACPEPEKVPDTDRSIGAGIIQAVVMAAVGAALYFLMGHHLAGMLVWGLTLLWLTGLFWLPKVRHGFERVGAWLGRVVGGIITWILLVPMYLTVFGLGRLMLNLRGRDPMRRKIDSGAKTYWDARAEIEVKEHWLRQY